MKKIKSTKLSLTTETIKQLDDPQMSQAVGGATNTCGLCLPSSYCPTQGTCFCTTNTQYPCVSQQHGC